MKKRNIFNTVYTLSYFISLIPLKIYDILHGTEFSGIQKKGKRDGYYEYYPSPLFSFSAIRKYVRRRMRGGKGHQILDIGCGKGFMLQFFSMLDFDKVAGIEYDRELYKLARKNLKKNHKPIRVFHMDAMDFSGYIDYDTFYLYNPFGREILEKCVEKMIVSTKDNPRKLTVIYCNPCYSECLIERGFRKVEHFYYKTDIYVYNQRKKI